MDQFTTRFSKEIQNLITTLKTIRSGSVSIVGCANLDLQSKLFTYFRNRLTSEEIYLYLFEVNHNQLNLVKSLSDLTDQVRFKNLTLTGQYKSIVIFVYGLEKLNRVNRNKFFKLLNTSQTYFSNSSHSVVIWAKPFFIIQMTDVAPEFWNTKKALIRFSSDSFTAPLTTLTASGKTLPLQHYLEALLQDPDYAVWNDLYLSLKAIRVSEITRPSAIRHTFTDTELEQLNKNFQKIEKRTIRQIIFQQGDLSTDCYVILSGEVEVMIPDTLGNEIRINWLKRGDFFGEIALIKNIPRTATVKTITDCEFIVLTKPKLRAAASKISNLLKMMGDIAEHRFETIVRAPPEVMSPLRRFANQQSLTRPIPINVIDLIKEDNRTIILGEAGSGKTTVLQYITLKQAQTAQQFLVEQKLVNFPIYIKLRMLTANKKVEDLILDILQGYGLQQFKHETDIEQLLQGQLQDTFPVSKFTFIMDGLNEVVDDDISRQALNHFMQRFPQNRFILSCRIQDYMPIPSFRTALLQNLTRRDVETFLVNYLGWEQGIKISREIYSDPQLLDLTQTPLALYMFTQITQKGAETLPKNRGVLFNHFINNLLERVDTQQWQNQPQSKTPLRIRRTVLAKLGLIMQEAQTLAHPKEAWFKLIAEVVQGISNAQDIKALEFSTSQTIHQEIKSSGLLQHRNDNALDQVEFAHNTYQEYFAALALHSQNASISQHLTTPEALRYWYGSIILLYGISTNRTSLFSQIVGADNNYARIWLAAQCLASSGEEIAVAAERFEQELPIEQHFVMLFCLGLASHELGRYPEALSYLLKAAELQPGNAEVQYELGSLYRKLNQYKRAINHLEEAILVRPDFVDAYNQMGIAYYDQQKYEEALTVFLATTQLEATNPYHYFNLGTIQKILKDYSAARNTFQTAVQLKSDYSEARIQLDLLDKALSSGVVQVLKSVPMLSKLTLEQSIMLANHLKITNYKAGNIVFHMGEMGDTFYIIEYGNIQVLAPDIQSTNNQNRSVINNLKAGDFFGEIALLRAVPRTATIRCATDVRLLELSRKDFNDIIDHNPSIAHNLAETSGYRLLKDRKTGRRVDVQDYYDPTYLKELVQQQDEVTVVMGDIHGSTFLTNAIGPELMVAFLDEYLLRMSDIIVNAGGAMDKSLGDSVMGVFGKFPERPGELDTSPALRALFASFQMRQAYLTLREEWKSRASVFMRTGMGIGISTGSVTIGTVGAEGAMVGAAVNLSNKLSKMAIKGRDESEVYIDERSRKIIGNIVEVQQLDPNYVIGKSSGVPLNAYRVISDIKLNLPLSDFLP